MPRKRRIRAAGPSRSTRLGITTLVEGVETPAQRATVRAAGAQGMQGYLFSPPRPVRAIQQLVAAEAAGRAAA